MPGFGNNTKADYVFCDKANELPHIIDDLLGSSTLFVDCEGTNLGTKSGHLSLIALGMPAPSKERPYIVDIQVIGKEASKLIFMLLESSQVRKVMFDGRMDQSALFQEYGVIMQNVVDLQLVDIKSRCLRGEGLKERMSRLCAYLSLRPKELNTAADAALYEKLQVLRGLGKAVKEHGIEDAEKNIKMKAQSANMDWVALSSGPRPRKILRYTANDISLISGLWARFEHAGYIDADLPEQSLKYIRMWLDGQPEDGDTYKFHALLPLGILDDNDESDPTCRCIGCGRNLPQPCFSQAAWNHSRKRKCLVCRAIGIRLSTHNRKARRY
ncbi:ribonuclease H-like domain-containing protein [Mycena polygramma]|nr:ribonuclease H-like domain-containing protein [Mycena polygramma]